MADGDQVTTTDQGQGGTDGSQGSLGWRAALSDEFKEHEFVKTFSKPTDFVKSALEIKTERDSLKTKLDGAIFKPGKDANPEELTAYRKALGIPETAEGYDFPKGEGVEHDDQMVAWARGVFHQAGLSVEQAAVLSQAWDGFIQGIAKAEEEAELKAQSDATEALKVKWGADFNKNIEFAKRGFRKFAGTEFDEWTAKTGHGHDPVLVEFLFNVGKAMGEDWSPPGTSTQGAKPQPGMNYDMPSFA